MKNKKGYKLLLHQKQRVRQGVTSISSRLDCFKQFLSQNDLSAAAPNFVAAFQLHQQCRRIKSDLI